MAIDAGSIGFCSLALQRRIEHVVLSHTHLDLVVHIKPAHSDQVLAELRQLGLTSMMISEPGREYEL